MLKYFSLTAVLLYIQVGSVYANNIKMFTGTASNIHIDTEVKDEQRYQLSFQKIKQEKISSQAKVYYSQARNKSLNKNYKGAIFDYTQAIKIDPNYADAYRGRGTAYFVLNDYQKAIFDYTQAIKIDPNYADAYTGRGSAYVLLKNYQKAMNDLNQAIKINPNDGLAYLYRSYARAGLGDIQGFTEDSNKGTIIMRKTTHNSSGGTNFLLGRYKVAIAEYTQAIKIDPNYAEAYYNRGKSREKLGDYEGAIVDYTQVIKIDPNYIDAYFMRGDIRSKLGDNEGAIADYTQVANFFLEQGNMEIYQGIIQKIRQIREQ
ncbi:MAG: tetratricopeptide repeat protein [Dolichospermum sp.]